MTFSLDELHDDNDTTEIKIFQLTTHVILGFVIPENVPRDTITFSNRRLSYALATEHIIQLDMNMCRYLDWKEGDRLAWSVYQGKRTNFFKKEESR